MSTTPRTDARRAACKNCTNYNEIETAWSWANELENAFSDYAQNWERELAKRSSETRALQTKLAEARAEVERLRAALDAARKGTP